MTELNHLLHDWATRQEPTPAGLDFLQARIAGQLADVVRTPAPDPTAKAIRTNVGSRSIWANWITTVVVAASLVAAAAVFWSGRREESAHFMDLASLPSGDLASRRSLFNELDRMFDGRWRWLSEVNGHVHLETDEPSTDSVDLSNEENSGVAVRLMMVKRLPGESKWKVVWEASVLARSEEWVRLPVEQSGDNAVSLWAYSLPDGSVLVESDVTLTAPVQVRLSEQQVFGASRRPARLWSARRSDGEFQLIQSIASWEAHHG